MHTFESLLQGANWVQIPNCPGRYVLREAPSTVSPEKMAMGGKLQIFHVSSARDPVAVLRFSDGSGLITYIKPNGLFLHTLNTTQGMSRKLEALGIGG